VLTRFIFYVKVDISEAHTATINMKLIMQISNFIKKCLVYSDLYYSFVEMTYG